MFGPDFFPTPRSVAHQMLAKVNSEATYFLEPSAGRGDLADAILGSRGEYRGNCKVDCIEVNPDLASILKGKGLPVVGYDWLTYPGVCYYDAIVMNPPFSEGDAHLLRAWDFLHDGEVVCLLNDETVKNPHTAARQRLAQIIREHGSVDFLGPVFKVADRKTMVSVALVYLKKVSADDSADLWAKNPKEEKQPDADINASAEECMLAIRDQLGNMEHFYNMANDHMVKAFEHLRKGAIFMKALGIEYMHDYERIPGLAYKNVNSARAEFLPKHRHDAWLKVFETMSFHKWLDKKQTDEFIRDIETHGNIPFTAENIKGTLENVFLQRKRLFEQSVANVFDELTRYYKGNTFCAGGGGNGPGWKANDSYKVNEKLVFPYGCRYDDKFGKFDLHYGRDIDIYNDLDRVLSVLEGKDFTQVHTIGAELRNRFGNLGYGVKAFDNYTESRYFKIRFYKKGTVHLWFKDTHLWEQFNQTAASGKRWLGGSHERGAS